MCHIEGAINRLPELEKTGIKSTVCGPESFTPDHNPIMGESAVVRHLLRHQAMIKLLDCLAV